MTWRQAGLMALALAPVLFAWLWWCGANAYSPFVQNLGVALIGGAAAVIFMRRR